MNLFPQLPWRRRRDASVWTWTPPVQSAPPPPPDVGMGQSQVPDTPVQAVDDNRLAERVADLAVAVRELAEALRGRV